MQNIQQIIVIAGILLIVVMGIFPPWVYVDDQKIAHPMGYAPLWKPPVDRQQSSAEVLGMKFQLNLQTQTANTIDLMRLIMQIAIVATVTGGALFMFKRATK